MSVQTVRGFILDCFQQESHGQTTVYAMGRLADGRTFGLVDTRLTPCFAIRALDKLRVGSLPEQHTCTIGPSELTSIDGDELLRVSCPTAEPLRKLADKLEQAGIETFEADIPLHRMYRITRGITGPVEITGTLQPGRDVNLVCVNPDVSPTEHTPSLTVMSLDIETTPDADQITAVSLVTDVAGRAEPLEEIHIVGGPEPGDPPTLICHVHETMLLNAVLRRIRELDPDIITGWNVIDFDFRVLIERCTALNLAPHFGRSHLGTVYLRGRNFGGSRVLMTGRQVIDGMHLARHSLRQFEDFRLETVAQAVLNRGKLLEDTDDASMPEVIERARREDQAKFATYCLEDAVLVRDILDAEGLLDLNLQRSILTGLPLDRAWGSIAAFEFLYIHQLHRRNMAAPTVRTGKPRGTGAPGGLVLKAHVGLYRNVFVFDFKSLYPSVIRTFNIDPWTCAHASCDDSPITAPNGVQFCREPGILPAMLDVFFERREQAKCTNNMIASHTYKTVMNSFYGVLGTANCRFGSSELAGAITSLGQMLLRWTRDWFAEQDCRVIYGDTDSLFVVADMPETTSPAETMARGQELCLKANNAIRSFVEGTYSVRSQLELEFEKTYLRFLMPPARGQTEKGRAKGYAGLTYTGAAPELDIVGMEAVRSDWTDAAHQFQRDLLTRLFADRKASDIEAFIADWVGNLRRGLMDDRLVYRRRLRKNVDDYTRTTPPHVKAARMLKRPGGMIHYVVTTKGPQPVGHVDSPLDYDHYIEKQIMPLVEMIEPVSGVDANAAVKGELRLF